jgi:tricorn protease
MRPPSFSRIAATILALPPATARPAVAQGGGFLTQPAIHGADVAFSARGDLWVAPAAGGVARRLTRDPGRETGPRFSPDGAWIAFNGEMGGGTDVYVVPTRGGEPRRLTFDPYGASVVGWMPDGSRVLFRSARQNDEPKFRLWSVPMSGGAPTLLRLPPIRSAAMNRDGRRVAYVPAGIEGRLWFGYRGGQADDVWLADLADGRFRRLTSHPGIDTSPAWVGDTLYFVSERAGVGNLFRLDPGGARPVQLTRFTDFPARGLSADGARLVFEHGAGIALYDPATKRTTGLAISLPPDSAPALRTLPLLPWMQSLEADSAGGGVLTDARGQIVAIDTRTGVATALAPRAGARDRLSAWSPRADRIAFVSDRSGAEEVWMMDAASRSPRRLTSLGAGTLGRLRWSADGRWLLTGDRRLRIWLIDAASGRAVMVDQGTNLASGASSEINESGRFSPDGRWVAYAKLERNDRSRVYLYEIATGTRTPVTPRDVNSFAPVFDGSGRWLAFLAEREFETRRDPTGGTVFYGPRARVTLLPLSRATPSPFLASPAPLAPPAAPSPRGIDLDGIERRAVDVPLPSDAYTSVDFLGDRILARVPGRPVAAFDLATRLPVPLRIPPGAIPLADGVHLLSPAADGLTLLAVSGDSTVPVRAVSLADDSIRVDVRAEWRQIYREAARAVAELFYDPAMRGRDWPAIVRRYEPQLAAAGSRDDLDRLLGDLLSELSTSHARVGGGDLPASPRAAYGFLGVDLEPAAAGEGFRIARILPGDGFDLRLRSPLAEPGVGVREGEYLLAVDGTPVGREHDVYEALRGRGGDTVALRGNGRPSRAGARTVVVRALEDEGALRAAQWAAGRRAMVERLAGPGFGYVHLPTMSREGLTELAQRYFAAIDRDAIILDVRNNGGGWATGVLMLQLASEPFLFFRPRYGDAWTRQPWAFTGPRALLCDESSGSNAEELCYSFRRLGLGPVVGRRTEGGVIGSCCGHRLVDGGMLSIPNYAEWVPEGGYIIEGTGGVTPDAEVPADPAATLAGRDPELERAVTLLQRALRAHPPRPRRAPPLPAPR